MDSAKHLLAKPTTDLLADFGAGKAAPGSGSAAALMGLLACRMLVTVSIKTLEKPELTEHHRAFTYIKENVLGEIEPKLRELFERDARDFEEVVRLRVERNKATDAQTKSLLSRQANDLLETATDTSFDIVDQCLRLVEHGIVAFNDGWHAVRGDAGAAISAGIAGVTTGIFIANLNLKTLGNRRYATDKISKCSDLYRDLSQKQARAFECVTSLNAEALNTIQLPLIEP